MENAQKHQGDNRNISTIQMFVFFGGGRFNTIFLGIHMVKKTLFGKREVEVCSLLFVEFVAFDHRMFFAVLALFQF